jgi:cytochrome P450
MLSSYAAYAAIALIVTKILHVITQTYISPLRSIQGPFLARFTSLWYLQQVFEGSFEFDNIELHRKYGRVVRLAPNLYSIDDPDVVKAVYGIGSKFEKSDWYYTWQHPDPDRWSLFTLRDSKKHADERRKFQALYSLSSLVHYEPYVNDCLALFKQRMKEIASVDKSINMAHWVQCYAFDVIAGLTYSRRFGFLDAGDDVDGLIAMLEDVLRYSTLLGIYAWLHTTLWPIATRIKASGAGARAQLNVFLQKWLNEKTAAEDDGNRKEKSEDDVGPQDFLDKMLIARRKNPEKISQWNVYAVAMSNITAGSDTTAATISGILYHLLNRPDKLQKLREEIAQFEAEGKASRPIEFKETQQMPYLQAVMKEGMRMHAAVGLPLWRVVPPEGLELCGQSFPPGTVVGLNAWCAHYNERVFQEPHEFRPERWIESEQVSKEELKQMDAYYLPVSVTSPARGPILISPTVRSRVEDMYWPPYLDTGDVEADPRTSSLI